MGEMAGRFSRSAALALAGLIAASVEGCATRPLTPPVATYRPVCTDVTFPVYFAEGSDQLTDVARQVVTSASAQVRGCRIGYVKVLGLTDAHGTVGDNLDLSRRRAASVASDLSAAGLPAPKFEVSGAGEEGALTSHGKPVPLRRKVEVIIHPLPN